MVEDLSHREAMPLVLACSGGAAALIVVLFNGPVWVAAWAAIFIGFLPAAFARYNRWQQTRAGWGGILIAYPMVFILAYTLGSVKFGEVSVLGVDPAPTQWLLYATGLIAWMVGVGVGRQSIPDGLEQWIDRSTGWPALVGTLAVTLAAANYATGGIPLLAANVNATRFGENASVFGQLTGIIVGMEQFALVAIGVDWLRRRKHGLAVPAYPAAIALACTVSLALSASRTFLILPLIAIGFVILERRVIRVVAVTVAAALVLSGLTWFNLARQEASGTRDELQLALERNGLERFPLASGLLSLQVGPRVFELARERVPASYPYQDGQFFLTDGSLLLRTHRPYPSDFFTTTAITGRKYEVVGGSPPTVVGGLYIDGGPWLIALGMLLLGFITRRVRDGFLKSPHIFTGAAYGYWSAWMLHSIYNYVSLKPMVVAFLGCALIGALITRRQQSAVPTPTPVSLRRVAGPAQRSRGDRR